MLVGNVSEGRVIPIRYDRIVTRLASGIETGLIGKKGIEDTQAALKRFGGIAMELGAKKIKAVGTSALREARNASELINSVGGLEIEVVSGEKEAFLTAKGVLSGLKPQDCLILDIGGGSTEWIAIQAGEMKSLGSVPAGVVKLHERHIRHDPPTMDDMKSLGIALDSAASEIQAKAGGYLGKGSELVITAGTASTLAAMDMELEHYDQGKIHSHRISLARLEDMAINLERLPMSNRVLVKGLEPSRADLIIPGINFTIKVMKILGFQGLTVSEFGLLEGLLLEMAEARH